MFSSEHAASTATVGQTTGRSEIKLCARRTGRADRLSRTDRWIQTNLLFKTGGLLDGCLNEICMNGEK